MRLVKIWLLLLRQSLIRDLEYRTAFLLGVLGSLAWIGLNLATLELIFRQADSLAGWNKAAVFLLFGTYRLIDALYAMFIRPNLYDLISFVHTGELDLHLTRPLPSRFFLSLRRFHIFDLPNVAVSAIIVGYASRWLNLGFNYFHLGLYVVSLLAALVIVVSVGTSVASLIFWFQGTQNLHDLYRTLFVAARVPVGVFRTPWRQLFTFLVPLAFLGTFPAQVFQGIDGFGLTFLALVMAAWFLVFSQLIWNKALRVYSSASS